MRNPVSCTSAERGTGVADAMITGVPDGATAYTAAPAIAIPDVVSRAIRETMLSLSAAVFRAGRYNMVTRQRVSFAATAA